MVESGQQIPLWQRYQALLNPKDFDYLNYNEGTGETRRPVLDALSSIHRAEAIKTPQFGGNLAEITTCTVASIGYGLGLEHLSAMMPDLQRFVGKQEMLYETLRDVGSGPPSKLSPRATIDQLDRNFRMAKGFLWVVHQKADTSNTDKFDPVEDAALLEFLKSLGMENQTRYLPHMFAGLKRAGDNPFFDVFDICGQQYDPNRIFFPMTSRQVLEHAKSYGPNPNDRGFDYPSMLVKWL